ncbi:SGNH hydrolase domain-containing protein [Streptomyces sp. NPDC048664]|uniref:SGNH hydrolase domain-containing protein n=1 Tax=Streptomyces sp. NPDC048664 TaxID=3154505 RepID=UPI003444A361
MPVREVLKGAFLCLTACVMGWPNGTPSSALEFGPAHSPIPCYANACTFPERSASRRNIGLPPWGSPTLLPGAEGKKVLVVGDSWARDAATGITASFAGKGQVKDAAALACGIREPFNPLPNKHCPKWRTEWPSLMEKVRPDAVLMSVQWDAAEQQIDPRGNPVTIRDDKARKKFVTNLDRAIRILSVRRTPVYVFGSTFAHVPGSVAVLLSGILLEFSRKYPGVHYLDLYHQLCNDLNQCPRTISGFPVYGTDVHTSKETKVRLGNWILNSMFHHSRRHA